MRGERIFLKTCLGSLGTEVNIEKPLRELYFQLIETAAFIKTKLVSYKSLIFHPTSAVAISWLPNLCIYLSWGMGPSHGEIPPVEWGHVIFNGCAKAQTHLLSEHPCSCSNARCLLEAAWYLKG